MVRKYKIITLCGSTRFKDMVRFMAEQHIEDPEELKAYDRVNYRFSEDRSTETEYFFVRENKKA